MASRAVEARVLGTTHVPLLRPPPPHLEQIPLSFFDAWFLPQPPIQRLFLYDRAGSDDGLPDAFPSLVRSLKSSLADAIAVFFPLAGKLSYLPSGTGDVVVDCSPPAVGAGVAFLEAEARGDARSLSGEPRHDVPAFLRLVPTLEANELPAPVLAVQSTRFEDGGVAVGVAMHHAVADGHSFWRFMGAWSAAVCGRACSAAFATTFDRSAIVHPMAAEMSRGILKKVTTELPLLPTANLLRRTWLQHGTTTLELDRHRIDHLKNRIAEELNRTAAHPHQRSSTFVAVSALVWSSVVQARSLDRGARTRLLFLADCRPRLDPPVHEGYFGNCVRGCVAEATAGDLLVGADGDDARHGAVVRASKAIREAVDEFVAPPLAEIDTWFDQVGGLLREPGFVAVTASPRFPAYAADFGWGAPRRVEFVSESAPEGMVVVTCGRKEGSVQVSACLRPVHVQPFRSRIVDL